MSTGIHTHTVTPHCEFCLNSFAELFDIEDIYNRSGKVITDNRKAHLSCLLQNTEEMFHKVFSNTPIEHYNDDMLLLMERRLFTIEVLCKAGTDDDKFYKEMENLHTVFTGVMNLKKQFDLQKS